MARLVGRRYAGAPVKSALLDQRFLSGVGNIYADESLWAAKIHPLRKAGSLSPGEARRLFGAVRRILTMAVDRRGSTVDDYRSLDGPGRMQERLQVYGRAGAPCAACEAPLVKLRVGGRGTVACPNCQRL